MSVYGVKENKCLEDLSALVLEMQNIKDTQNTILSRISELEGRVAVEQGTMNAAGTLKWTLYCSGKLEISGTGNTDEYDNLSSYTPIYSINGVNEVVVADGVGAVNTGAVAFESSSPVSLSVNCTTIGDAAFTGDWTNSITIGRQVKSIGANAFLGAGTKYHAGQVSSAPTLRYTGTMAEWKKITLSAGWNSNAYFNGDQVVCTDGTVAI
ncbi:MAG: hypothetical protein ACLUFB_11060 [Ruminococcus sp.]|uniref:hypothetical protein n=1 Tax=Ruminococcus sp. TaxID=41978 RepID=UPI00262C24EF|nr:hypothetical protein [uncultured Ruminococcus sp.]